MEGLKARILELSGARVSALNRRHGGDLSSVYLVELEDGRSIVAKQGPLVDREARMLDAIAAAGAPVPMVLGQSGDLLLLEALAESPPGPQSWSEVGRRLATLHACESDTYGWEEDYAFGPVRLVNSRSRNWPDFWAENRLRPQCAHLPSDLARRVSDLLDHLPRLLPADPTPSLLHGDLWAGNLLFGPALRVHFIDPACYHGDREVDLAMLCLFGQPGPGFAEAYGALASGWERRRAIYTLWPALVHLRLFGSGYRGLVDRCLTNAGA